MNNKGKERGKFSNKNLFVKERDKERAVKQILPQPQPTRSLWRQKIETCKIEEYENTLRAMEGVAEAYGDLEVAVGGLGHINIKTETNRNNLLVELEQSRQELEGLTNTIDAKNSCSKTARIEEEAKQAEAEARLFEAKLKAEQARKKISDLYAPPKEPEKPKSEIEKFIEKLDRGSNNSTKIEMITTRMNQEVKKVEENDLPGTERDNKIDNIKCKWGQFMEKHVR